MFTIILFIIVLSILVFVHELGHFLFAKLFGMRVDEFGLGFPPKFWSIKKGETEYSLNALPIGGFVKIYGEDSLEKGEMESDDKRSFISKPRYMQAIVLVAGVSFNVLLAWFAFSIGFMGGLPTAVEGAGNLASSISDKHVLITSVIPNSPAEKAGLKIGDKVVSMDSVRGHLEGENLNVELAYAFIAHSGGEDLTFVLNRESENKTITIIPTDGVVEGKPAIGVSMSMVGILKLPFFQSLIEGAKLTWIMLQNIVVGLGNFFYKIFTGGADFSQVAGPVGIATLVGDASRLGFGYLLNLVAVISLNLAVINLLPIPALDGGRLVFVAIEAITRRPIKASFVQGVNTGGFVLLILLLAIVTYNDVIKIFFK